LNESVFLSHVGVFGVILPSQHSLLLLKVRILAGQSEQVKIQERVLFGQLNDLVLHRVLVVSLDSSESGLQFLAFVFLLLDNALRFAHVLFQKLFFLFVVALDTEAVLVQLILSQKVASNLFIQVLDILLLVCNLLVLPVVKLESFLQLQL